MKMTPTMISGLIAASSLAYASCGPAMSFDRFGKGPSSPDNNALSLNTSGILDRGVSLAGADFGGNSLPGTYNVNYTYPTTAEVDYFMGKGMTTFRIPFLWERMQPTAQSALNTTQLGYLDTIVNYATGKGARVIIDPHNYARYYGQVIGAGVSNAVFADFWTRLAQHYESNSNVIFALMNEPHDLPTEQWEAAAQAAINAIRATGAKNLLLVPGNSWTGASSWTQNFYGTANSVVMLEITDPANNYVFEVHQYLDSDGSGSSATCVNSTIGSQRLEAFTAWAQANGKQAFLGEFGSANNATCLAAVGDMLNYMQEHSSVYLGWTWWAAGPWWGNYIYSIEPTNTANLPLMNLLAEHLQPNPVTPSPTPAPSPAPTPAPGASPAPAPAPAPAPSSGTKPTVGPNGYPYCTNGSNTGSGYGWDPSVTDPHGSHSCLVPPVTYGPNGYPYCTNGSNTGAGYGWDTSVTDPHGSHSCLVPPA